MQRRVHRVDGRITRKRATPRQDLVDDAAEREDVGAVIDGFAAHLLG